MLAVGTAEPKPPKPEGDPRPPKPAPRRDRRGPAQRRPGRKATAAGPHDHGLFVVGRVFGEVLDLVLADFDGVVVRQELLLDGFAVDVGAVGAVEVLDEDVRTDHLQHRVLAADGQVVDHDVVVRPAPEGGFVLGELDFLDHHAVE
jgi:hypothetical protein